jgi:sucrose-6-phosphate hydrolase SacC (GH32 family)
VACYLDAPGVCLAFSTDGVDGVEHQRNPIEPRHSDTHHSIVWDPARKIWLVHLRVPVNAGGNNRRIALMQSADLDSWSRAESVLVPDEFAAPGFTYSASSERPPPRASSRRSPR